MVPSGLYKIRYKDAEFDQEWSAALLQGEKVILSRLEAEADRRAMEGYLKPIYYNGVAVGAERRYSDTLLIVRLKALAPHRYKERPMEEYSKDEDDPAGMVRTIERIGAHRTTFKNGKANGNGKARNGSD